MPILSRNIRDGEVTTDDIADGTIAAADIAAGAIGAAALGADAVETTEIKNLAVTAAKLAADAVETAKIKDANVTPAKTIIAEARTATAAPGGTTGVISDTTTFVTVTCDDANKVITLPTPTPGRVVTIRNGATGYELRSSAPGTVAINGGTGSNAESAIAANILVVCRCDSATTWVCTNYGADGTVAATEAAA